MAKATKKPRAPRAPRPRQGYLDPDLAPPSIPELDKAAEEYVESRDARMALLKQEIEAKNALLALMKEHKLDSYTFDSYVVTRDFVEGVKVRRKKTEENGEVEE